MTRKAHLVSFTVVALVAAACGGGGAAPTPRAAATSTPPASPLPGLTTPAVTCKPSGTKLTIAAKGLAFSKDCLAAPANQPFTIEFHNNSKTPPPDAPPDIITHNVSIKSTDLLKVFFTGKVITKGKAIDYHVKALAPGAYVFKCDVHPHFMYGTFVVS